MDKIDSFWMEIQEDKEIHFNKYGDILYKNLSFI